MFSLLQNLIIHEDNVLEYTGGKNYVIKGGGVRQMLTGLTKVGGEVWEMLTMANKGGRGVCPPPPFLDDIICEQPLSATSLFSILPDCVPSWTPW